MNGSTLLTYEKVSTFYQIDIISRGK